MHTLKLISIQNDIRKLTGFDFTLVGGCVRDTMYGAEPKDYDAVVCMCEYDDYSDAHDVMQIISRALS